MLRQKSLRDSHPRRRTGEHTTVSEGTENLPGWKLHLPIRHGVDNFQRETIEDKQTGFRECFSSTTFSAHRSTITPMICTPWPRIDHQNASLPPSTYPNTQQSIHSYIHPPIYLFIYIFIHPSIHLFIHISIHPFVHPSINYRTWHGCGAVGSTLLRSENKKKTVFNHLSVHIVK